VTRTATTPQPRRRLPRPLLAASGASLLLAAGGMAWVQSGAGADPVSTDVAATCTLGGSSTDVTVPMTVDDIVDPVAPRGAETLNVDQGLGQLPVEVTVDKVVVTTPIPAQVASTDSVTFEGGNMAGSSAVDGTNLVVTFTGPQSSSQLKFPRVVVHQTIADAPSGTTIEWKVWSSLVTDTNYGQAVCTPKDAAANLNTTAISGAGGSTSTAPGSTSTTSLGGGDGATTTTTAPADGTTTTTAPASPGVSVCVTVTSPLPIPAGAIPCPITLPPSAGSGLPVPVSPSGGGLPVPLPVPPSGGGLPVPLPVPPTGSGLPVPVPPAGGTLIGIGAQVEVSN
jgi:hypothetical protein